VASIKDLKLGKDVVSEGGWDAVPEQIGSRRPPLQPGPYRFQFPSMALVAECFDTFEVEIDGRRVTRVVAKHRDGAELTVTQAPARYVERLGEPFGTRITNAERRRGKKDDAPKASDMDYVLATLGAPNRPHTNREYLETYLAVVPGKDIGADVEWNWRCDDKRPVRVPDPDNEGRTIALDGEDGRDKRMGCGSKFYQKDIGRVDADGNPDPQGEYPRTVDCTCGAILFANENLQNFRK
jgi:hypothetical protein